MEERKIVCCVVVILVLLCAVSGFVAEITRKNVQQSGNSCSYPRSPAYGLGITAAVCLILAQITIGAASRCPWCCSRRPDRSPSCWPLVVSWILSLYASLELIRAALWNDIDVYMLDGTNYNRCPVVERGLFALNTILGLVSLGLGLTYYIDLTSSSREIPPSEAEVAMGQSQCPPREGAQSPVFVHEDTYARRQVVQV